MSSGLARIFSFSGVIIFLYIQGCSDNSRWFDPANQPSHSTLTQIDATKLENQSLTTPIPLEHAATRSYEAQTQPSTRPIASVELTLADVRMAALANNLDLQVELINPAIAQQSVDREKAKFEATFNLAAAYENQQLPGVDGQNQSYSAGISQPLLTGGTISLNAPFTQLYASIPPNEGGLQFSISQPLLRNAGVEVNTYSIRAAQTQKNVADAQTKLNAIRILANADRAYWLLYETRGELAVNEQVYELGLKQIDQAKKRVAAQASPAIEIERAESGAASALEGIILSETQVKQAVRELKRIMHRPDFPIESPTMLVPITKPNPLGLTLSAEELANHAIANRMEMLQLEIQLSLDSDTINFDRNQALPLFVLDYNYNLNRFGSHADQVFQLSHGRNYPDWTVQLTAQIPIGNQAAKSQLRQAILERVQRLATREQQRLAIQQEVYDAVDQFNQNWQRILAARNESVLAGRTYEAERHQFDLGVRTSTDVLDAAQALASAQLREVEALTDFEISHVDIAFATGTLLGETNVSISP